jgi:serine/threonine-protein kinase
MPVESTNEQIGKYSLIKKLATGGMAHIFLAEQSGPGGFKKRLVIKRILPHLLNDEKFLQMFQDEARVAAMMNHPNIVQIFDLNEADEGYYIAMEYVPGYNLRAVIQISNENGIWLAPEYIAKLGSQICEGLEYAHNFCDNDGNHLNIIHRDVSPQNIILSNQGTIKIVDFGIAKAKSNAQETQAGIIKGKLAYMSPEQVKGQTLDRRSDIFSLGIVMYELATHQRPFQGKSDIDMLRAILDAKPTEFATLRPDFPQDLAQIIYRSLAKDRDERYASARELQWDLEQFIQSWGKPITPFQLQELVRRLEELEEKSPKTKSKSKKTAEVTPTPAKPDLSRPSPTKKIKPPPPPPIPTQNLAPAPPPISTQTLTPQSPLQTPAPPEDFEDAETMLATDLKLSPHTAASTSGPHYPNTAQAPTQQQSYSTPNYAAQPPTPPYLAPPNIDNATAQAAPHAHQSEWGEDDATVMSLSPITANFKPQNGYAHNQYSDLGNNDLDTICDSSFAINPDDSISQLADTYLSPPPNQNQTPNIGDINQYHRDPYNQPQHNHNMMPHAHHNPSFNTHNPHFGQPRQWPPPANSAYEQPEPIALTPPTSTSGKHMFGLFVIGFLVVTVTLLALIYFFMFR